MERYEIELYEDFRERTRWREVKSPNGGFVKFDEAKIVVERLKSAKKVLQARNKALKMRLSKSNKIKHDLSVENARLQSDLAHCEKTRKDMVDEISAMDDAIGDLRSQNNRLQAEIEAMKMNEELNLASIGNLREIIHSLRQENQKLKEAQQWRDDWENVEENKWCLVKNGENPLELHPSIVPNWNYSNWLKGKGAKFKIIEL